MNESGAIEEAVYRLLSESAQNALETMFFAIPDAVSTGGGRPAGELFASRLTFQGTPPGKFGLLISEPLARNLAESFTGCDDPASLTSDDVSSVIGELTNMLCGVALSELEAHANFDLSTPEPFLVNADEAGPDFASGSPSVCRFEFPEGALVFFLKFEDPT
jgi:CheY-specific phosphatase CheX